MRIHAFLIVGLLSVQIHAADTPGTVAPKVVSTSLSDDCTSKLMSQSDYMKGLVEQIQSIIKRIEVVINMQPQPPNTSGMSDEDAEKVKKQYRNAVNQWRRQLESLKNKLAASQKKLTDAEKELRKLKHSCHKEQNKQRQMPRTELDQRNIKPIERSKSDSVNNRIAKIQAQSRKQQKEVTQILKKVRSLLQ